MMKMLFSLLLVILCDHVHHVFGITCEGFLMDHPDKKICRNDFGYEFRYEAFGLTLSEAQGECGDLDTFGNVISIQNKDENDFIFQQLNKRRIKSIFLGLQTTSSGYEWMDGTTLNYTNWGEVPKGARPILNESTLRNPCIEYDTANNGMWSPLGDGDYDVCPLLNTHFVCKYPLVPPTESVRHFVASDKLDWMSAKDSCSLFRMNLVVVNDLKENILLNKLLQENKSKKVWIGLYDPEKTGKYRWVDDDLSPYRRWCPGHPNDISIVTDENDCVTYTASSDGGEKGCFSVENCMQNLSFICERETEEMILLKRKISALTKHLDEIKLKARAIAKCQNCNKVKT